MPLTDAKARNAKPRNKPLKLFDTEGLFLMVSPGGGKWWRFKYRFGGKEKLISLGTYPEVSLAKPGHGGMRRGNWLPMESIRARLARHLRREKSRVRARSRWWQGMAC